MGMLVGEENLKALPEAVQKAFVNRIYGPLADEILPLFRAAYPDRNDAEMLTLDYVCRAGVLPYVSTRGAMNDCTYSYIFCQDTPIYGGRMPAHCADIPYLFHNTSLVPSSQAPGVTRRLEKLIFESLMAFARTGSPETPSLPKWHPVKPGAVPTMLFGTDTREALNHDLALIPAMAEKLSPVLRKLMDRG